MAYSLTNPPQLVAQGVGGKGGIWLYKSVNAESDLDDTDFISNAADLGMVDGDIVFMVDQSTPASLLGRVLIDAQGNGTISPLTAIVP